MQISQKQTQRVNSVAIGSGVKLQPRNIVRHDVRTMQRWNAEPNGKRGRGRNNVWYVANALLQNGKTHSTVPTNANRSHTGYVSHPPPPTLAEGRPGRRTKVRKIFLTLAKLFHISHAMPLVRSWGCPTSHIKGHFTLPQSWVRVDHWISMSLQAEE